MVAFVPRSPKMSQAQPPVSSRFTIHSVQSKAFLNSSTTYNLFKCLLYEYQQLTALF